MTLSLLTVAGAYLVGAIPFGYLAVRRLRGVDLREHGSGNIGATNAARVLGDRRLGAGIFLLDAGKGFAPVFAARTWGEGSPWGATGLAVACAVAAFIGHCWPVYLGMRGGKGVATGGGAAIALAPMPALAAAGTWIAVAAAFRYVSLASMVAAASLPGWFVLLEAAPDRTRLLFFAGIALLVVARHRANLRKLIDGSEYRLGGKETR